MNNAFIIDRFRKLDNWKLLEIDRATPMGVRETCPSDQRPLATVATIVGNQGREKLRIGCCEQCGYVGYIDCPTKEWIDAFYARVWDRGAQRNIDAETARWQKKLEDEKERRSTTQKAIERIIGSLDKSMPVCDVGCGYGVALKKLTLLGFTNVIGMEASRHRAQIAKLAFAVDALTSPFETGETQDALRKKGSYGLIYSHHVLEHIYDPREFVRLCAGLQQEGGWLVTTLPRGEGEFSLGTLLYLPHLNAISKFSLGRLLNEFGYEVMDDSLTTKTELCLAARKVRSPKRAIPDSPDYFGDAVKKFSSYFGFPRKIKKSVLFWCFRDIDIGGRLPYWGDNFLTRAEEIFVSRTYSHRFRKEIEAELGHPPRGRRKIVSLVIKPASQRFISPDQSPLEIQFAGNIKFSYK